MQFFATCRNKPHIPKIIFFGGELPEKKEKKCLQMPHSMDKPRGIYSLVCKPRFSTTLLSHGKAAANAILQKKRKLLLQRFGLGYALID